MTSLASLVGKELQFVQPSIWKREYELRTEEGESIGTVKSTKVLRWQVLAQMGEQSWVFEEKGFWKRTLMVRNPEKEKPFASMETGLFRLIWKIKLPRYRVLRMKRDRLGTSYSITTTMNTELCSLKVRIFPKFRAAVTIQKRAEEYPELPWLILFLCMVSLRNQRNSRSAATHAPLTS